MSERDRELWGMLWRFGLVILILGVTTKVTEGILIALSVHPFIGFWVLAAIWLTPMYRAYRKQHVDNEA